MRNLTHFLNYTYIIFVLLWDPLHNTILTFDSKERSIVFLSIAVFLINFISSRKFQQFLFSKPVSFWGIWVIYSCINLKISGYHEELPFSYYVILEFFSPFLVMLIVCLEFYYNHKKLLHTLLAVFCVYGLFTLFLSDIFGGFTGEQNLGSLGNMGPLNTMFIVFYSGLLFANKWIKRRSLIYYIFFACSVILLMATRKAFGASLIMIIFTIISQYNLSMKNFGKLIAFSLIIIYSINLVLDNTTMGKRISTIQETGKKFNTTNQEVLNLLGDRAFFYIEGWSIFLKRPITGIGINNFTKETGTNYRIHSEYIVQLTEGGIIGSTIFLFFYLWISRNLYKSLKESKKSIILVLIGGFFAIIFVNGTAWTYAFPHYFACFGIIIGYLKNDTVQKNALTYKNNYLN